MSSMLLWCINALLLSLVLYRIVQQQPTTNPGDIFSVTIYRTNNNTSDDDEDFDNTADFKELILQYLYARRELAKPYLPPSMLIFGGKQNVLVDTGNSSAQPMMWYRFDDSIKRFLELGILKHVFVIFLFRIHSVS